MSESNLVLRPAVEGDVEAVLRFWLVAGENTDRHDTADGVRRLIARDPEALVIAELDGRMVGTLIAGWDGWRCHLYRLAVDPEARRRGVARTLLAAAEERFAELGGLRSDAMVINENVLAHQAWTALGYRQQNHASRWVKPLTGGHQTG
ncbi:GNAT family N-acetyltransferase [Sphaerisporangium rubeum]|uniref:Ribosomal protein S18 acetylase RimI-like enzyme n=1 Tax=Sphaerisporangium rubeum TaxID=321317 RepID=A0A7X0IK40_9ACTN|nr:GNAT family N-acetyltransferase [Sphaerisporangium rubeum]MBB6476641.1 ribosomal protein S18 acetylase RimI-like enzyme [Sphaerisporangium rubeum]